MILVRCIVGSCLLIDGEFIEGDDMMRDLYTMIIVNNPPVASDGPVDGAIAFKMLNDLPGGYEILEEEHPEEEIDGVN